MSLALVHVSATEFQQLHDHLATFTRYQNMHMRQTRQQDGHRVMRSLHAVHANNPTEIEGMISGPELFVHYRLKSIGGQTQLRVLAEESSAKEQARTQSRFVRDILARVYEEQTRRRDQFPRRLSGQAYLQRSSPGMAAAHPHCASTVTAGLLDQRFVARLEGWNLKLLIPP